MAKRENEDIIDFSRPSTTPLGQVIPASSLWQQMLTKESLIQEINDDLGLSISFYSNAFTGVITISIISPGNGASRSAPVKFAYYDRDDDEIDPVRIENYTSIEEGLESFLVDGKKLYDFCPLLYRAVEVTE